MRHFVFALCALWALALPASASGPDRVSILLGSHHSGANQEFEEFNPGLFLTWDSATSLANLDVDLSVGLFQNSYGRAAVAAVAGFPFYERGVVELSGFVGVANYPEDGRRLRVQIAGDVIAIAGLQARIGPVFFQAIPSDGEEADAIFSAGVTFPISRSKGR